MQFGPGFLSTFLYYFASTAIVFTLITAKALDVSMASGLPQQMGLLGGLVAGLLGGYFNRTITWVVPLKDKKAFLQQLNDTLSQMGYQQRDDEDGVMVYERSVFSRLFSGRVFVQLEQDTAAIASRSIQINALKKHLPNFKGVEKT